MITIVTRGEALVIVVPLMLTVIPSLVILVAL